MEWYVMALVITGGIVVACIAAVVVYFLMLDSLTPGKSYETVEDGKTAITKVQSGSNSEAPSGTTVAMFGLVSFAVYKFVYAKKTEQKTVDV